MGDRAARNIDQVGAVIIRHDAHALGKYSRIELFHFLAHSLQRWKRFLTPPHQDDSLDDIGLGILADTADGHLSANAYHPELFDIDWRPVLG